jgi:hypothetical protein
MTEQTAGGLTFEWPTRERFPWALFGFVFLSLVAHVATFFIFQVTYPQRVTIPPPGPQVAVLAPLHVDHTGGWARWSASAVRA